MLFQIHKYIRQGGIVSSQQLAREFRLDLSALQPMLDTLQRKGVIKTYAATGCKSTCSTRCRDSSLQYYGLG